MPAREVERERTRQIARIGSNLNQIARWAHIERDLAQLREYEGLESLPGRWRGPRVPATPGAPRREPY